MKRIGVVGAGVMGAGVAQCLAQHGFQVVLVDLGADVLDQARERIRLDVRMGRLLNNGPAELDPDLIQGTTDYDDLAEVDFVIENITEKWELKQRVYPRLDQICRPDVVFAANTSALSITRIAALTRRPDRVIGLHFMNPVPMKPSVEVIRGWHTSAETVRTAEKLLAGMGKNGIVVGDAPGFVSNRVLMLTINEAVCLVHEQVATAEQVDRIFTSCFGHRMGPLETADLIGLDTILYSVEVLYESYNDSKYRPCPLLRQMVDAGLHGRKSGQGFYTYR
ncbi:3-hydroxyacyl-CoA dehydrogenase family protein [Goodfellowiella coeruleoviolacea]|uniref:3-hydroxyacyl-CoA dehydrogenase n=1 Tax=Goodfellowiella coeruleoviolacea TaxID=334858 RepID=A0AAE3KHN4_9PSEU|nr:3-hydroxyacyl-CoA dehydrogenase NAD-binding domain-containing protein [Goodfellowiella coeruleoviolacea]MCP2168456.1 3-hydroxyacyl-CoA dehydrogenase (EC 1.1.1.35) [Goodfellowiella coeruleoviolacea]